MMTRAAARTLRMGRATRTGLAAAAFAAMIAGPAPAVAAEPQRIGDFQDWSAYTYMEDGNKVCYMASQPAERSEELDRGDIYAMIVHRPQSSDTTDQVLIKNGYPHDQGSTARITVDGENWTFDTEGEIAFTLDREAEREIVAAIRRGLDLGVRARSERGNTTGDSYSLRGSNAAYEAISEACDL